MARKRQPDPSPPLADIIALPVPQPHRGPHEHRIDPYRTLPGPVPPQDKPKRRGRRKSADIQAEARAHARWRMERYDRYLDALCEYHGDTVKALSIVYQIDIHEAERRRTELLADVQTGLATASFAEQLVRLDMDKNARLAMLRKHMFAPNPAQSLKALDMIEEMDTNAPDIGSYEHYVRMVE